MYASGAGAGATRGVLPSDDLEDGGMTDAPQVVAPRAAAAAGATASGRACNKRAAAAASSAQSSALLTLRGPGDQGAAAPGAAASTDLPRKRAKGAGGGSAGEPAQAHGPRVMQEELSRMSALADTLRAGLLSKGVSEDELVSRCLPFRGNHLPSFPVVKSGAWARLSTDSLAAAVVSVVRDKEMPAFDGLWKATVKGSYHYKLTSS